MPLSLAFGAFFLFRVWFLYNEGMETLDYNKEHWAQSCPKVDCRKKACQCGLEYVNIPVALEASTPAVKGAYCNAIVEYEGSGAVYIYSKEGIPVKIKEGNAS